MKKIELTEKQKKILKTTVISVGGVACTMAVIELISRSPAGKAIKQEMIGRLLNSICGKNGADYQLHTFTSYKVCNDGELVKKAHEAAYELYKSILKGETTA